MCCPQELGQRQMHRKLGATGLAGDGDAAVMGLYNRSNDG
jgi:hypothetical protein